MDEHNFCLVKLYALVLFDILLVLSSTSSLLSLCFIKSKTYYSDPF